MLDINVIQQFFTKPQSAQLTMSFSFFSRRAKAALQILFFVALVAVLRALQVACCPAEWQQGRQ